MNLRHTFATSLIIASLSACGGSDVSAGSGSSGSGDGIRKYSIESGIIEYELSGTPSGKETLYFDRWGAREVSVKEHVLEMGDIRKETNTVTITEGAWITTLDEEQQLATRMKNPLYDGLMAGMKESDAEDMGEKFLKSMGGKSVGTEEVAGRTCTVWEIALGNSRTCIWEGITLKTETKMGAMTMSMVATSVDENPKIPASRFEVPSDYEVVEQDLSKILGR